jgi:hypothetical protein
LKGVNLDYTDPCFNMSLGAFRAASARGGRQSARTRRLRRLAQPPVVSTVCPEPELEAAHQASTLLDKLFPRLRNAWGFALSGPASTEIALNRLALAGVANSRRSAG